MSTVQTKSGRCHWGCACGGNAAQLCWFRTATAIAKDALQPLSAPGSFTEGIYVLYTCTAPCIARP